MSTSEKWIVTEYPGEGDIAVACGSKLIATICGGDTFGYEVELAERISRLPELERQREQLVATIGECRSMSLAIQSIVWGDDGDCGARDIARDLEELTCIALDHLNPTPTP